MCQKIFLGQGSKYILSRFKTEYLRQSDSYGQLEIIINHFGRTVRTTDKTRIVS